eukprot:5341737-Pyramimonas_sp.AAC.1
MQSRVQRRGILQRSRRQARRAAFFLLGQSIASDAARAPNSADVPGGPPHCVGHDALARRKWRLYANFCAVALLCRVFMLRAPSACATPSKNSGRARLAALGGLSGGGQLCPLRSAFLMSAVARGKIIAKSN